MNIEFLSVPAIVAIVYFIAYILKASIENEKFTHFIPCICGAVGCILAVVCYYVFPGYLPACNLIEAVATGVVSGLSATGVNQVFKQLFSHNDENDNNDVFYE